MTSMISDAAVLVSLFVLVMVLERACRLRPWTDASAARLFGNIALTVMTLGLNAVLLAVVAALPAPSLDIGLGLADSTSVERAVKIALAIVLLDFTGYAAHVLMHKVGALWRLHVVHHSDVMVDVTTGLRQHPFEAVIRFAFTAVPVMALGIPPESAALYRLLSGANAFLEHANMTLPRWLEPTVRAVFVTPAMHKVHHSRFQPETDSNYGNIFSIFDRLARTYRSPVATRQPADAIDYGLDSFPATPGSGFVRLLALR